MLVIIIIYLGYSAAYMNLFSPIFFPIITEDAIENPQGIANKSPEIFIIIT